MKYISYLAIFLFMTIHLAGCGNTDLSSATNSSGSLTPEDSEVMLPHDETLDQIQDVEEQLEEQGAMENSPGEMQAAVEVVEGQGKIMNQELAHEMAVIEQIEEFERQNSMLVEAASLPVQ